ncbi:MAG: transglycosylase SLT domain-containing protein [Devosia sp.]
MGVQPITIPQSLAYVLNNAGDKSGVDFNYLLQTAQRESALNPTAKAPSSSAVGLFQFLDSTWLQVMKQEGPRLGYQKYADAIATDKDGDYVIKDKKLRTEVLKLREDPQVAADMAAAFTRSNGAYLEGKFGRMPSPGELYIAHFLGPQGAEKMFNAGLNNADQVAAKLFPRQAKANPQIFYANDHARTIREVYKALVAKHDGIVAADVQPDPKFAAQQMAADPASKWSTDAVPSRFSKADMSFNALFSTERPTGVPTPLIGMEAAGPLIAMQRTKAVAALPDDPTAPLALLPSETPESLAAIDAAMSGPQPASVGDPFDAPSPLLGTDGNPLDLLKLAATAAAQPVAAAEPAPVVAAQQMAPAAPTMPQARVLMSPGQHTPNSAFFAQLLTQR